MTMNTLVYCKPNELTFPSLHIRKAFIYSSSITEMILSGFNGIHKIIWFCTIILPQNQIIVAIIPCTLRLITSSLQNYSWIFVIRSRFIIHWIKRDWITWDQSTENVCILIKHGFTGFLSIYSLLHLTIQGGQKINPLFSFISWLINKILVDVILF